MEIKRRRNEKKMRKERQRLELQSDGLTDTAGIIYQSVSLGYSDTDCDYGNTDRVPWLVLREILDQNLLPLPVSHPLYPWTLTWTCPTSQGTLNWQRGLWLSVARGGCVLAVA